MNIQIFGTAKCQETKKAQRYYKERNIKFQYVDLLLRNLSKGELQSVKAAVGLTALLDSNAKEYKRLNLERIVTTALREELLLSNPGLLKTPIVRNGSQATVGYRPEIWKNWD